MLNDSVGISAMNTWLIAGSLERRVRIKTVLDLDVSDRDAFLMLRSSFEPPLRGIIVSSWVVKSITFYFQATVYTKRLD